MRVTTTEEERLRRSIAVAEWIFEEFAGFLSSKIQGGDDIGPEIQVLEEFAGFLSSRWKREIERVVDEDSVCGSGGGSK